ncbi:hypothetical protein BBJ28_00002460 [Nothophytophthora sp. Chile5]|nr:hypothetical protein BBJ28_00002460 [Nothophytophthora sp. Chile5]
MDYRQYKAPASMASSRGMARLNGSNRAAWNAMDLQIGSRPMPGARPSAGTLAVEDNGALSARNVLIHQKLRERKRYDSADEAMRQAAARASGRAGPSATAAPAGAQQPPPPPAKLSPFKPTPTSATHGVRPFSPAQLGQSAFFNAMKDEKDVDMKPTGRQIHRNTPSALREPLGGPEEGRNVLIQRKLLSKSVFDSADYQLALARRGRAPEQPQDAQDTDMEDVEGDAQPQQQHQETEEAKDSPVAAVSSPCASSAAAVSRRQQFASMSPSRGGKYGALENRKKLSRCDLLKVQQEGSSSPSAATATAGAGASKYGKLCAAHVLIRRKLKERKRFDSADYAMELQGQAPTEVPGEAAIDQDPAGEVATGTSATTSRYGSLGSAQTSISHQVKHIKLSEDARGRVASPGWSGSSQPQPVVINAAQAALAARAARYGLKKNAATVNPVRACDAREMGEAGAAAGRSAVLQRKLAERKMFDSADHFKKAA